MRGSVWCRCAIVALGSAASIGASAQQIGRGPVPGGENIAPSERAPQPYYRTVLQDGVVLETGGIGVDPVFMEAGQSLGNPADYVNVKEFHDTLPGAWTGEVLHENFLMPLAPGVEDEAGGAVLEAPPAIFAFDSIGPNDLDPPDPDIAVGPNHIAVVTNDDFAVYDKCGNELFRQDAEVFFGTPPADLVFDPKVIYDPWNNRWVMLWHVRNFDTDRDVGVGRVEVVGPDGVEGEDGGRGFDVGTTGRVLGARRELHQEVLVDDFPGPCTRASVVELVDIDVISGVADASDVVG
ncbi:MAG: hypothetical protein AAFY46_17060, partial [Planctomycetota bacterium]